MSTGAETNPRVRAWVLFFSVYRPTID